MCIDDVLSSYGAVRYECVCLDDLSVVSVQPCDANLPFLAEVIHGTCTGEGVQ